MGKKRSNKHLQTMEDSISLASPVMKKSKKGESCADTSIITLDGALPKLKRSKAKGSVDDDIVVLDESVKKGRKNVNREQEKSCDKKSVMDEVPPANGDGTPNDLDAEGKKRKKKHKKSKKERLDADDSQQSPPVFKHEKKDPWMTIEDNTAVSAAILQQRQTEDLDSAIGKSPNAVPPGQRRTDRKKQRSCDGSLADIERPVLHENGSSQKTGLVTKQTITIEEEKTGRKKNGTQRKRRVSETLTTVEGADYIVQEPESPPKKGQAAWKKFSGVKMANLFDDEAEDSEDEDEEIGDEEEDLFMKALLGDSDDDETFEVEEECGDEEDEESIEGDEEEDEEEGEDEISELFVSPGNVERVIELGEEDGVPLTDSGEEEVEGEVDGLDLDDEEDEDDVEESDAESTLSDLSEESVMEAFVAERKAGKITSSSHTSGASGPDFSLFPFSGEDSTVAATKAFAWIIANCDTQTFFDDFYQQNALIVRRHNPKYYGNLLSVKQFTEMLAKEHIEFGSNVNIAEYRGGVRYTMNGEGRVYPGHVQEHLAAGRSVQLVNPQTFAPSVWYLCELLQELFGCFVGANTYLTPAGSAGFAPHWDEIDAFLLQLEGRKYWKVYAPDCQDNELPRESSGNFSDKDLEGREPCFEGWLEAGDMLYIPRGFIHQASTAEVHSFHVTVSVGRRWSFADLVEKMLPVALEGLAGSRVKLRRGLPVGMLDITGVADCEYKQDEHEEDKLSTPLAGHLRSLSRTVCGSIPVAVDLMAREFMRTALPPMLTPEEKKLSVAGYVDVLRGKRIEFSANTRVKLIRRHAQRLIFESEQKCFVVHRMTNSLVYEGRTEQSFEMDDELVTGFSHLQSAYPEWTRLDELPGKRKGRVALAQLLYTHGLLLVKN